MLTCLIPNAYLIFVSYVSSLLCGLLAPSCGMALQLPPKTVTRLPVDLTAPERATYVKVRTRLSAIKWSCLHLYLKPSCGLLQWNHMLRKLLYCDGKLTCYADEGWVLNLFEM